jgi:hypothetical protein
MVAISLLFGDWKPIIPCFSATYNKTVHYSFFGWVFAIGSLDNKYLGSAD